MTMDNHRRASAQSVIGSPSPVIRNQKRMKMRKTAGYPCRMSGRFRVKKVHFHAVCSSEYV